MEPQLVADDDVRARVHPEDRVPQAPKSAFWKPESARAAGDAGARVIPINRADRQEQPQKSPESLTPGGLAAEAQAAVSAIKEAAEGSDWASEAMTPVAAWKQVAPLRGEAGNWIIWTGMTAAGVIRGLMVSIGYLIACGGETRIRASVAGAAFVLALAVAYLAGHAS